MASWCELLTRPRLATAALGLALWPAAATADVFHLKDGDRISGRIASRRKTSYLVKTPYGSLTLPKSKIVKVVHDDGTEEVLNPPEPPPATPEPPPPPVRLILVITGQTFWHAWDPPKGTAVDPTLRLQVSLDEAPVATYTDAHEDPEDLPRALVNTFSFAPEDVVATASGEAQVLPPEARPGRIVLKIDLPPQMSRRHRLRMSYQVNEGAEAEPSWRDAAEAALELEVREGLATFVHVRQDRGRMEFSGLMKRKMKNVETFRIEVRAESGTGEPDRPQ